MDNISVFIQSLEVSLKRGPDIIDITSELLDAVRRSKIMNGNLSATMIGSTGSLTTIEYEPGVIEDLKQAIERLAPVGLTYAHEKAWHDGNGHSHVQAALLGPSIVLPIRQGSIKLGTWQQVVAINHDNRSRKRNIEITITGSS